MKRMTLCALVVLLAVGAGSLAVAQGGLQLNGREAPGVPEPTLSGLSCYVKDESGNTVTNVRVSNPWSFDVVGYWVVFGGGGCWKEAKIVIKTKNSCLPEKKIVQRYIQASPYCGNTAAPFALTDFGGGCTPYGTGKVIVGTNLGEKAVCTFTISAY